MQDRISSVVSSGWIAYEGTRVLPMKNPLIMVAPTGARRSKADHPALPIKIPEIVATAKDCFASGADALHLHVRDDDGAHTLDAGLYREALAELAGAVPEMRLQITTEAAEVYSVAEQMECLRHVRPSWASISIREIAREENLAARIYGTCVDNGTEVQHILYNENDARLLMDWSQRGILSGSLSVLLVLGSYSYADSAKNRDLQLFLAALPSVASWMLCAFGKQEHQHLIRAAELGGDLRVGFENSMISKSGERHADNAASLRALKELLSSKTARVN